jgi:hypothetical protein
VKGSLDEHRAEHDDRSRDAKNFQAIVSHTRSVGKNDTPAHRTEASVTFQPPGLAVFRPLPTKGWQTVPALVTGKKANYFGAAIWVAVAFFLPTGDDFAMR